ncbi:MAG: hypothetical protein K8S23_01380 [Candidatus Cloacimonetes bacterium]|nr:hypothetical protein [Candidatus Cloacimonadota bacterium]
MTLKDIAALSCKIIALTIFIKTISTLNVIINTIFSYRLNPDEFEFTNILIIRMVTIPILSLLISIILWFFAKNISSLMVNDIASINTSININYEKFKALIFSRIGIFVLTQAIPSLGSQLIGIIQEAKKYSGSSNTISSNSLRKIVEYSIKILIAIILIIRPKRFLDFIKSTRTLGVTKEKDESLN